jgi:hypothetical protein
MTASTVVCRDDISVEPFSPGSPAGDRGSFVIL